MGLRTMQLLFCFMGFGVECFGSRCLGLEFGRLPEGRALVNQARFAVLAIRRPSLTHPAVAGLFQASAYAADNSASRHTLASLNSALAEMKQADHGPLIPTISRG